MFKKIGTTFGIISILSLTGCAGLDNTINYLASPKVSLAVSNLKNVVMVFDCGLVVPASGLSQDIATLVDAGKAAISTTGKVYAVSAAICTALGGIPSTAPVTVVKA